MTQITVNRTQTSLDAEAAKVLHAERATLNPFRLAFNVALGQLSFPGHDHFLDKVKDTVAAAKAIDPYDPIVIWAEDVTQFIRLDPDVETFRTHPAFYPNGAAMSEAKVDALFRVAQAIDDGADLPTVGALIAAFEAEDWN